MRKKIILKHLAGQLVNTRYDCKRMFFYVLGNTVATFQFGSIEYFSLVGVSEITVEEIVRFDFIMIIDHRDRR